MAYFVCLMNMFGLLVFWARYAETTMRRIYFTIFLSCFIFTYFGGLLIAALLFALLGIEKIGAHDDTTWHIIILSEICLFLFLGGYVVAAPLRKFIRVRGELNWRRRTKPLVYVLSMAFLFAVVAYVIGSGGLVLLRDGGYENRYDANVGMGGYSLFFSMGLFGCTLLALRAETVRAKRKALIYTIGYCAITFVVLGGYRQLGFAALFSFGAIALLRREVAFAKFLLLSGALIIVTLVVAIFRYTGTSADSAGGIYGKLMIFFYDGFAPVDAFYNIVDYCRFHTISENVIANQFATMIPRALWQSKPLIVLNAGNFYTQYVLGREGAITYSPTLLGELYLVGGAKACALGSLLSGAVLRVFDEIVIRSSNSLVVAFFLSFAFVFVFNLYREGLSVLATKVFLFGAASLILTCVAKLLVARSKAISGSLGYQ